MLSSDRRKGYVSNLLAYTFSFFSAIPRLSRDYDYVVTTLIHTFGGRQLFLKNPAISIHAVCVEPALLPEGGPALHAADLR
jgi:hypothetical protein